MQRAPIIAVAVAPGDPPPPSLDAVHALGEVRMADDASALAAALERADVVFAWDFRTSLLRDAWPKAAPVRWIHAASIGVDAVPFEAIGADVVVTHTRGVFERAIAEYVIGLILLFAKDLPTTLALQAQRAWRHRETETLAGRRLLLLGAGPIAREVARLTRPLGMDVVAVARRARGDDPDLGVVHGAEELDDQLELAEFVVVALPLTDATRSMLDAKRLARLRWGARVINVGRGAVIDEAALLDALHSGQVAGAALDVFAHEPLGAEHPFWTMPQVVVSPHMSGDRVGWREDVVALFVENLRRWRAGEPLAHVVKNGDAETLHQVDPNGATSSWTQG